MPELPEVERVRRTLAAHIVGRRVTGADLCRRDFCESWSRGRKVRTAPEHLLVGASIAELHRHGKQIAIVADSGAAMCAHLGMTGNLRVRRATPSDQVGGHAHVRWTFGRAERDIPELIMEFTDPRRFGGLWTYPTPQELQAHRWARLGPDALSITADHLADAIATSTRSVKSVLLDQSALAGVGNIYADESLFLAKIHPATPGHRLSRRPIETLAAAIRDVLAEAISAGGSTLRDFRDADDTQGNYQDRHRVYGRSGLPCPRCGALLRSTVCAQRTTVFCPRCQKYTVRRS